MITATDPPEALRTRLDRWVAAGLLAAAQADRILEWEEEQRGSHAGPAAPPAGPARRPLLVEGMAYLGGVIILVAVTVVLGGYWHTLSTTSRVALAGSGAVGLLLAGSLIPQRLGMFAVRLRAALWLLSTICLGGTLIVLTDNESFSSERSILLVSSGTAAYAVVLWLNHRSVLQHLAAFAAAQFLAVALVVQVGRWSAVTTGVTQTAVAVLWAAVAWAGLLPGTGSRGLAAAGSTDATRSAMAGWHRRVGRMAAAVGASIGAVVLSAQPQQPWLGLLPVALVLGVAMAVGEGAMLSVGAVATLITLPLVVTRYFDSTLAVAFALLGAGGILVGLAVVVARRRLRHAPAAQARGAQTPQPDAGAGSQPTR